MTGNTHLESYRNVTSLCHFRALAAATTDAKHLQQSTESKFMRKKKVRSNSETTD
jgi:hypothetical protein